VSKLVSKCYRRDAPRGGPIHPGRTHGRVHGPLVGVIKSRVGAGPVAGPVGATALILGLWFIPITNCFHDVMINRIRSYAF
jgi:hypothetical protein